MRSFRDSHRSRSACLIRASFSPGLCGLRGNRCHGSRIPELFGASFAVAPESGDGLVLRGNSTGCLERIIRRPTAVFLEAAGPLLARIASFIALPVCSLLA
jgi:hypothetical protein